MKHEIEFLPLTDDFVFKKLFTSNNLILLDFLNAFFETLKLPKIQSVTILNPEISAVDSANKKSVLDIKAKDEAGNYIFIEMQSTSEKDFGNRILYYSCGVVRESLEKGELYKDLKRMISINILNFEYLEYPNMISSYSILNEDYPQNRLTDQLKIFILELKK